MASPAELTQELEASLPDIELDLEKSLLPPTTPEATPVEKVSSGLGDKALGGVAQFNLPKEREAPQEKKPTNPARHNESRQHADSLHPTVQPSLRHNEPKHESQDEIIERLEKNLDVTADKPAVRTAKHHSALHHPVHAESLVKPRAARVESKRAPSPEAHQDMQDMSIEQIDAIIARAKTIIEQATEIKNQKQATVTIEVSIESPEAKVIEVSHGEHKDTEVVKATPAPPEGEDEGLSWDKHRDQYLRTPTTRGMSVPSIIRTPHNEPAPVAVEIPRIPEKTEAEKALEKAEFDRWWTGMQHRFGVEHWEKSWNESGKESIEALNKDITAEMTPEAREEKRQQNRHAILLGRVAAKADEEKMIQDFNATSFSEGDQQSLLDEVAVRIGAAIETQLTEPQRNEYKAIFDANQSVISAWLEQHEPDYKETDPYKYVAAGYETNQEKIQPEKVVASLGWVTTNVPQSEEIISKVTAAFKAERASTVS